jgi:spermidine synthase
MIVPATLMGFAFPLVGELYAQKTKKITSGVGNIYGANTLGNVCGALIAGFILLAGLGTQNSLKLAIVLNLAIGVVGTVIERSRSTVLLIGISLLIGGLTFSQPPWDKYLLSSGVSIYTSEFNLLQSPGKWIRRFEMLFYKEGPNGVVTVHQRPDGGRFLKINGKVDASNSAKDKPTELLLGYVPLFLHSKPQTALVIGLGSGITARTIAQYDFIQQVDNVEIEPAVVEAATKYFRKENKNIQHNPKVKIIVDDARSYLKRPDRSYDFITSEPSNPWMKGIGNLFSTDFYQLCRRRLKAKGIMCQWIHCYGLSPEVLKMAVNTFRQSFPFCQLWYLPSGGDALMIGSEQPITFDWERMEKLINYTPEIKKEMNKDLMIESPTNFLAYFTLNNDEITNLVKGAALNTDNYPRLEFLAPYDLLPFFSSDILNYRIIKSYKSHILPNNFKQKSRTIPLIEYYYSLSRVFLLARNNPEAYQYINEALKLSDQDPRFYLVRGRIYASNKDFSEAIADFEHCLKLDPNNDECSLELAYIFESLKGWGRAQEYYQKTMELDPNNPKLLLSYAYFLFSQGKERQALPIVISLTSSFEVESYMVWELLGDIYARLSNFNQAQAAYEKSFQQNTSNYMVRIKLGELVFMQGRVKEALEKFEASREMLDSYKPKDVRLLFLIADCYIRLDQYDKAAEVFRQILRKDLGNLEAYKKLTSIEKRQD